jgi:hypothetical protein
LLILAACTVPEARMDYSEPVTVEDMTPLPPKVTVENASQVVRKCLQRHRKDATDVHHRYGYAFFPEGFVQLYRFNPIDRGNREKLARVYVSFDQVESIRSQVVYDMAMFRDRYEVRVRGTLRRWEAFYDPYRALPPPGEEPSTHPAEELVLVFKEALTAKRLEEALELLR